MDRKIQKQGVVAMATYFKHIVQLSSDQIKGSLRAVFKNQTGGDITCPIFSKVSRMKVCGTLMIMSAILYETRPVLNWYLGGHPNQGHEQILLSGS